MIDRVRISPKAWRRMLLYVDCCETEVGGLGIGTKEGTLFNLEEVVLLDQWVTGSDVLLSPGGLARFLYEFVESGGDPGRIKVWWHSHVNHPLRWSGQDEETIVVLNQDYLLSLIGNKSGRWLCRLDLLGPPAEKVEPIEIEAPGADVSADQATRLVVEKEINEKVTAWEPVRLPGQSGYFFGTEMLTSDYSLALESYGSFLLPWEERQIPQGTKRRPEPKSEE